MGLKKRIALNLTVGFALLSVMSGCRVDHNLDMEPSDKELLKIPDTPFLGTYEIPDDNPMAHEVVELGRMLFYDTRLSSDNSISCASCHRQEMAFTDGSKVSSGVDDQLGSRNAMSLANLLWEQQFFWDGRAPSLESQALDPIEDPREMNADLNQVVNKLAETDEYPDLFEKAFGTPEVTEDRLAKAIAQFERTMISVDSKFDRFLRGEDTLTSSEMRGFQLFAHPVPGQIRGGNCGDCHLGYTFTNQELKNNGLDEQVGDDKGLEDITGNPDDRGKFKVPTLRNIALTAPYMHDGRFNTLEEVLDHYNDTTLFSHENVDFLIISGTNETGGTSLGLTEKEKKDIIAFLKTLTDQQFVNNPDFSDPFQ